MFNINAEDPETRETPLHVASRLGNAESVEVLVKYGAKTTAKNNKSKTPSQVAATEAIKKILETGFSFVRTDDVERLRDAIAKDKRSLSKFNYEGLTMIHVAAQEDSIRSVV